MEQRTKTRKQRIEWALVLGRGEDAAISAEELTKRLGFRDARQTRAAVSAARLEGVPVCSLQRSERNNGGYFLPDVSRLDQVEHVANELKKRAFTSLLQVKQLNKWIKERTGKESTFEQVTIGDFLREQERAENGGTE